jgi:hypothetical protein
VVVDPAMATADVIGGRWSRGHQAVLRAGGSQISCTVVTVAKEFNPQYRQVHLVEGVQYAGQGGLVNHSPNQIRLACALALPCGNRHPAQPVRPLGIDQASDPDAVVTRHRKRTPTAQFFFQNTHSRLPGEGLA